MFPNLEVIPTNGQSAKPEVLQPEDITFFQKNPPGLWLQFEGFIRMPSNFEVIPTKVVLIHSVGMFFFEVSTQHR